MDIFFGTVATVLYGVIAFLMISKSLLNDLGCLLLVGLTAILVLLWVLLLRMNRMEKRLDKFLNEK